MTRAESGDSSSRIPAWDGAFNLRDLGGLPTADGGTTLHNRVYRSGGPEHLTNFGWAQATEAGLRTVIDLRNGPEETARRPHHPVIDDAAMSAITVLNTPTEDPADPQFREICGPWLDHPRSYADNVALYPDKFALVFDTIACADGQLLVHCAAGRDRTGMVVGMLLSLNGVSAQTIADDYEVAVRAVNDHILANPDTSRELPHSNEVLGERLTERRAALIAWLDQFDVAGYLMEAGVSPERVTRLRRLLRE